MTMSLKENVPVSWKMWGLCVFEVFRSFQRPQRCPKTTLMFSWCVNINCDNIVENNERETEIKKTEELRMLWLLVTTSKKTWKKKEREKKRGGKYRRRNYNAQLGASKTLWEKLTAGHGFRVLLLERGYTSDLGYHGKMSSLTLRWLPEKWWRAHDDFAGTCVSNSTKRRDAAKFSMLCGAERGRSRSAVLFFFRTE